MRPPRASPGGERTFRVGGVPSPHWGSGRPAPDRAVPGGCPGLQLPAA